MPKIFELFGFRLDDQSTVAKAARKGALCPFMGIECDGGGNRYMSALMLSSHKEVAKLYPSRETLPAGVCSIQMKSNERPWVVCPRRLLFLGKGGVAKRAYQSAIQTELLRLSGFAANEQIGVWPELKLKYSEGKGADIKSFDYTFDYMLMRVGRISQGTVERATGMEWKSIQRIVEKAGYPVSKVGGDYFISEFPLEEPVIIEIMTSSTSGGNKDKGTTIPAAFSNALLGKEHDAPGINYRQVWARMVSQLVVKSEVALGWRGKTLWVLQDTLVDYISSTTALDIRKFLAASTDEVNILCISYGGKLDSPSTGVIEMEDIKLFSGPIEPPSRDKRTPSFLDMVRSPTRPSLSALYGLLMKRRPVNVFTV